MFNLVFASGHGGATKEIALLCKQAKIQLSLPGEKTQAELRHFVKDEDAERLQLPLYKTMEELKQAVSDKKIDAWLVARPETIVGIREHFGSTIPIIARHSINSFDKYKKLGLKNFISPSREALRLMGAPNQWLSVKARTFTEDPSYLRTKPEDRVGYYSYIHHFQEYWPRAYSLYTQIATPLKGVVDIRHFGRDAEEGIIEGEEMMKTARATIHIKDGQVCCNAPINSIAIGTPVLMDYETLNRLGMQDYIIHQVSGLLFSTAEECIDWIRILEYDNEYLQELCYRTYNFAKLKCQYTSQDLAQFRDFLYKAEA